MIATNTFMIFNILALDKDKRGGFKAQNLIPSQREGSSGWRPRAAGNLERGRRKTRQGGAAPSCALSPDPQGEAPTPHPHPTLPLNGTLFEDRVFLLFFLFRGTPVAYRSSQARGQIGVAAAGLHHSHSNRGSEPCL